jgi:mono/diheme cytochrome c family protein
MRGFVRPGFLWVSILLLAACAEQSPETTADGIFTVAQAQRGEGLFGQHCARCHSIEEFTGRAFNTIWAGTPAAALYLRIANTMPMDQPGSLGTEQSTALMAHILASIGMPAGEKQLAGNLEWLSSILIANN